MSWSQRPTLNAGVYPNGAAMEELLDQVASLTDPTWVDWSTTLAWTSSGTAPALGNAVKVAQYRRADESDMVEVRIKITFGGTSTFGTGVYFLNLPFNANTDQQVHAAGVCYALDAAVAEYAGVCKVEGATTFRMMQASTSSSNWGATVPFTFGNGDTLAAYLRYQTV